MNVEDVAAFLSKGRIVDLSKKVTPGGAPGASGAPPRRYELEQFKFPPGELMHYIAMESHISTHVEAPSHFLPVTTGETGEDVSEVALERFFGMATLIDCRNMAAGQAMGVDFLKGLPIVEGDIVLVGASPWRGRERPYVTPEGIDYLVTAKKIKMLGYDDSVAVEAPQDKKSLDKYHTHLMTLNRGVPLIEQMAHLEELAKPRFFFMGIPARMGGLESFPIRAVAIEPAE